MHLLLENVVQNLVHLWMGQFKPEKIVDAGSEDYIIPDHIWAKIGEETVDTVCYLPSSFVRRLGNIVKDQANYTAESWAFWFMYLAPILLKGRFKKDVYYTHLCSLVGIMKTCIRYSLTHHEIDDLEERIINWVDEFER